MAHDPTPGSKRQLTWLEREVEHPYDGVFQKTNWAVHGQRHAYTTRECLRILAASGFVAPVFARAEHALGWQERCTVTGPDGERYNGGEILALIFKAERLERLCQDRSDAVLGMLRRGEES